MSCNQRENYCGKEHFCRPVETFCHSRGDVPTCENARYPSATSKAHTLGGPCLNHPWSFERTQYDLEMMKKFNHC